MERELAHLSQTHSSQFLPQQLGFLQGSTVVEHWDAHHGRLDVGAGHHQDLPQPADWSSRFDRRTTVGGSTLTVFIFRPQSDEGNNSNFSSVT